MNQIANTAEIHPSATLGENVIIEDHVKIQSGVIIYDHVTIKENTVICANSFIGEHTMGFYNDPDNYVPKPVVIGKNSIIRSGGIIYEDVVIGDNFQTGHCFTIREHSTFGHDCSVGTRSELAPNLTIGNFVRMHTNSTIAEYTILKDYVWIYPNALLATDKYPPIGPLIGVLVEEYAQVAPGAIVLPGLVIGKNAFVGSGAIVTKDVGEERVVVGNPAKDVCSVRDLKNDKGEAVYPWKDHLKDYRGYPWQTKES